MIATGKRAGSRAPRRIRKLDPVTTRNFERKLRGRLSSINRRRKTLQDQEIRRRRLWRKQRVNMMKTGFQEMKSRAKGSGIDSMIRAYAAKKMPQTSAESYGQSARFISEVNKTKTITKRPSKGRTMTFTTSPEMVTPGKNKPHSVPVCTESSKSTKKMSGIGDTPRDIHKTIIRTGLPTSRTLNRIGRMNGTSKEMIQDTKITKPQQRTTLDQSTGFNSTDLWLMPQNATVSCRNILERFYNSTSETAIDTFLTDKGQSPRREERVMLSVLNSESNISLMNESAFSPIVLKFHVIGLKNLRNETAPHVDLMNLTFNPQVDTQTQGCIPKNYQQTDKEIEDTGVATLADFRSESYNIKVSNKANLTSSAHFRDNYTIVKTVTKRLEPHDVWQINHRHTYGSGVDYFAIANIIQESPAKDYPYAFMYMVEAKGVPVTAIIGDQATPQDPVIPETYQGTSAAFYHCEFKTSLRYVQANQDRNKLGSTGPDPIMHMRTFMNRDYAFDDRRERFTLPSKLVDSQTAITTVNDTFIPYVTDKDVVGAKARGLGDDF